MKKGRAAALLLLLPLLVLFLIRGCRIDSLAGTEDGDTQEQCKYVFEVMTGDAAGDGIEYFRLQYNGDRSVYVFPKAGDFTRGFLAADLTGKAATLSQAYCDYTDLLPFDTTQRLGQSLSANSTDRMLFETPEPIESIESLSFYGKSLDGEAAWNCQGIKLYEVKKLNGIAALGGCSRELFIDFEGNLICKAVFVNEKDGGFKKFTWTENTLFILHPEVKDKEAEGADAGSEAAEGKKDKEAKNKEDDKNKTVDADDENADDEVAAEDSDEKQEAAKYGEAVEADVTDVFLQLDDFDAAQKNFAPAINDMYGFQIDFADQPQAGLECESYRGKASLKDAEYVESLAIRLLYKDRFGKKKTLSLPVVTNALKWAADHSIEDKPIACIAQPGEGLFFAGMIPDLMELEQISLVTGNEKAAQECGFALSEGLSETGLARRAQSNAEDAAIERFAIYHMNDQTEGKPYAEDAMLRYEYTGKPVFYRKAETEAGIALAAASETGIQVVKPADDFDFAPSGWGNRKYLIGITTDQDQTAGTLCDMNLQLTYVDTLGAERMTGVYSLMECAKAFYGIWNEDRAPEGEFGYYAGVSPGNTIYLTVSLADVDYFTGANLRLTGGSDEWIGSGFSIWALDSLGLVKGQWTGVDTQNGDSALHSDVRFFREYKGVNMLSIRPASEKENGKKADDGSKEAEGTSLLPETVVVTASQPGGWSFQSRSMSEVEEEEVIYIGDRLSFAESLQDFGFSKARKSYQVRVKVADRDNDSGGNGDCGSESNFYFQLIFENGTSGIVLANHQLEGDRFRTGNTETFMINIGKDLGPLSSVRIIPEVAKHLQGAQDKLCIDEIRVVEQSLVPYADTYVISEIPNNGWIAPRFEDTQDKTVSVANESADPDDSISMLELPVTKKANELSFLVCLSTAEYAPDTQQFKGTMSMRVDYINTDGQPDYAEFDVVDRMYRYLGKEAAETAAAGEGEPALAVSDEKYMFRGEHTDRFVISLENVRSIYKATLVGRSMADQSELAVAGLSFNVLEEDGILKLTPGGEYIRTGKNRYLTGNMQTGEGSAAVPRTLFTPDTESSVAFDLQANELAVRNEGSKYLALYSEPAKRSDAMQIFIYPTKDSASISGWDLRCRTDYTDLAGDSYAITGQSEGAVLKKHTASGEDESDYFYTDTVSANSIAVIQALYLQGDQLSENDNCAIDHATIQFLRGGEIIRSCYLEGYGTRVRNLVALRPGKGQQSGLTEHQEIALQLSADTPETVLAAGEKDLAVSIRYKAYQDPSGSELYSPYRYLTDEEVYKLCGGQIVTFTLREPYVKEITGIRIMSVGDLSATVERAYAANYKVSETDELSRSLLGWYSFGESLRVLETPSLMNRTGTEEASEKVVQPLEITFNTAGARDAEESGTDAAVRLTIGYEDATGHSGTMKIEDIRSYITDPENRNFETGSSRTIRLLAEGIATIKYLEVEPYRSSQQSSQNNEAGWTLNSVMVKTGNDAAVGRSVGERIYEGKTRRISFSNVKLSAKATYKSLKSDATESKSVINENADFAIASGTTVTFRLDLYGSDQGFDVLVEHKVGDSVQTDNTLMTRKGTLTTTTSADYEFAPPRNLTGSLTVYYVTVKSKENPDAACKFTITVQPESTVSVDQGTGQRTESTTYTGTDQSGNGNTRTDENAGDTAAQENAGAAEDAQTAADSADASDQTESAQ